MNEVRTISKESIKEGVKGVKSCRMKEADTVYS